jgi:hypothetical protein
LLSNCHECNQSSSVVLHCHTMTWVKSGLVPSQHMPPHPTCKALLILLGATRASLHRCSMAACVIAVSTLCVECITTSAPASTADRGTAETCVRPPVTSAPAACTSVYWGLGLVERPVLGAAAGAGVAAAAAAVCLSCRPLAIGLRWPPCASSTSNGAP